MSSSRPKSPGEEPEKSLADAQESFTWDTCRAGASDAPGSFNDDHAIRGILSDAIKRSKLSREQIAEAMSHLIGTQVTRRALDSYTSESADQNRFPMQYARAFCHATGDWRLFHCVAARAGLHVIDETGQQLLELGREYLREKDAAEKKVALESKLKGVKL